MDDATRALAVRATRCKAWRWMDGMRFVGAFGSPRGRVLHGGGCGDYIVWHEDGSAHEDGGLNEDLMPPTAQPDLTDPATLDCLLALVRDAWGPQAWVKWWRTPGVDMSGADRGWCEAVDGIGRRLVAGERVQHRTEAEALVAALEAAP